MSWTLSTSAACIAKAGKNANSTIVASNATLATWSDEAESQLAVLTRKNWVTDYAAVTANFKPALDDAVSDLVAMRIVNYDMSGYTGKREAETILDVLRDNFSRILSVLDKDNVKEVMD
jgi:tellurite resistance protein